MPLKQTVSALALALALTACGSDDNNSTSDTKQTAPTADAEQTTASTMDKAKEMAEQVAEALKLDTSSLDSFKSSLGAMKGSLSGDQANQLTSALSSLAKGATEEKGGLLGAAKDLAGGKSMEEIVYEKLGDKLNGMTFEDILALAK